MHNSALLNCRWGNLAARKSNAAMVVVEENESFSVWLSCFAGFTFISISFLFSVTLCSREHVSKNEPMATSPKEREEIPSCGAARGNLSKSFAALRRTFPAVRRKPEKEQS